jgi:hypothetical protein
VSVPWIVILIVLFGALGLIAAITANLVRSAMHVGKAAKQFFEEATPLIAELQAEGERATQQAAKLAEMSAALRR